MADRAQVLRWRSALGAGAARCRGLLPDYAALPTATGLWTLSHDGGVLRARLGPTDGFSAEVGLAAAMLSRALAQKPRAVLWLGPPDAELEGILGDLPVHRSAGALPADLRPQLLTQGELALNFARDPQADAQAVAQALRRLMWPALLFVLGAAGRTRLRRNWCLHRPKRRHAAICWAKHRWWICAFRSHGRSTSAGAHRRVRMPRCRRSSCSGARRLS